MFKKTLSKLIPRGKKGAGTSPREGFQVAVGAFIALLTLGILGYALVIVLGNLQGSSGFAAGSQLANQSDDILRNITGGAGTFFQSANVWFVLLAVVIIIAILAIAIKFIRSASKESGGTSL